MINKRIFGADLPILVKKKLEARQIASSGVVGNLNTNIIFISYLIN